MFCSRCGQKVDESFQYCPACGQEARSRAGPPSISGNATVPGPARYAGFWVRVVAYLIDGIVAGIPFSLIMLVLLFLFGGLHLLAPRGSPGPVFMASFLSGLFPTFALFVIAQWLYFAGMESSPRQATFGKAALSLRVTDLKGQSLTFTHATGRFVAKMISGLIPLGIGYLLAGFTQNKQALHDMIAGTLVLRKL